MGDPLIRTRAVCYASGEADAREGRTLHLGSRARGKMPDVDGDAANGRTGSAHLKGQEIKLCCKGCEKKFYAEPEKRLEKIAAADGK